MSLFDRLGGAPAVIAAAGLFCRHVLAGPLLAPYFDDATVDRQVAKQAAFLTMALGGPGRCTGRSAHRARGWAWNWRAWDPASCAPTCAAAPGRVARMRRALFMAGMSLRSIPADE